MYSKLFYGLIYGLDNMPCALEKHILLLLGWEFSMSIRSSLFIVLLKSSVSSLICIKVLSIFWEWNIEVSNNSYRAIYFTLWFCQCLLHIFGGICHFVHKFYLDEFLSICSMHFGFLKQFLAYSLILLNTSIPTSILLCLLFT